MATFDGMGIHCRFGPCHNRFVFLPPVGRRNDPILSGSIGVRTHRIEGWFDNVVVLPIDTLP